MIVWYLWKNRYCALGLKKKLKKKYTQRTNGTQVRKLYDVYLFFTKLIYIILIPSFVKLFITTIVSRKTTLVIFYYLRSTMSYQKYGNSWNCRFVLGCRIQKIVEIRSKKLIHVKDRFNIIVLLTACRGIIVWISIALENIFFFFVFSSEL